MATGQKWILLGVLAAVCVQVFLPPFVGLADNGDFPKIAGHFSIGNPTARQDAWIYFQSRLPIAPQYHWESNIPSSETVLVWTSLRLAGLVGQADSFEIRYLGAIHTALLLLPFALLLRFLRPMGRTYRLGIPVLAAIMFTDVAYIAYFNSFYADTGAFLFLLLSVIAALYLARDGGLPWTLLFAGSAVVLVTSKAQHSWLAVPLALFLGRCAWRARSTLRRTAAAISALTVLAAGVWMLEATPVYYSGRCLFNVIFYEMIPNSPTPLADLRELGMGPAELPWAGMSGFQADSPALSDTWATDFYRRVGYGKLGLFFLSHPARLLDKFQGAAAELRKVRPVFGNYQRADGFPPATHSRTFALYSDLEAKLWEHNPLPAVLALLLVSLAGSIAFTSRIGPSPLLEVYWLVWIVAAVEFAVASVGESVETDRHFLLFHALLGMMLCFGAAAAPEAYAAVRRRFAETRERALPDHSRRSDSRSVS